ncbi:hypothetical protein EXU85_12275 [Spirosoma sp. KCTC 42546]|uniref:hypothetical protein n=1 Tax=Spirosoma sp. KCTC 42546 TaxID=2520506 RepID=UPI001158246E|nr:hypothetical protein [Spirosoma sp. KCTC 42546]QDK79335.1 hypothetical protein EXU85_12275 [Spirosoma sp. KCTC 42546]
MRDRNIQFLPECHADTALLRHFIPDHGRSIHSFGCPEVARTMLSPKADDYRLIGMVDNDPDLDTRCKGFFKTFELVKQEHKVIFRQNLIRQQYLIIIDRAVESFLLWNAEQIGLQMNEYGFGATVKLLKVQTKSPTIETDPNYLQLLTDLHTRQAPGFQTLERILNDLITT